MKIKNWKMKTGVVLSTLLLLATATVPNALAFSVTQSSYSQDGISVDIKQIKEVADNNLFASGATPSQALAQTIATMVSKDPSGDNGNFTEVLTARDVLRYFYPNASDRELEGSGITPVQAVEWLNSKGYTATIIDRPLTTEEIKKKLDNSEPIVTVLENQNPESWLNKNYAGVLYAHDDVETESSEGRLHASFIKSINYGEAIINDGQEASNFQFMEMSNSPDPIQAESTFKWVSTLTGIKRDPSWTNAQTIQGDKAKGVFAHKVTSDGTQSQVDFTDPAITELLNKYPENNKDHVMKLTAVSLINLYEDKEHQKTVKDLENFLKISSSTYITSQNIIDWYKYLGFDFDVINGRAPMSLTKSLNDSGRLYLTTFKAQNSKNPVKTTATIGAGYLNNSFNGYSPYWYAVKLGENLAPFYDVPLTTAGLKKRKDLAKTFKYTNVKRVVSSPFSKTDFAEDKTIYNIRLKGTTNEFGTTQKPTESIQTPPAQSTVKAPTNANYTQSEYFNIRETQNQEPWCSQYTNAAAVNTIYKATEQAVTSAKEIMRLKNPGVSDEELLQTAGGTLANSVKVLKDNYQISMDIEMRTLSFAEVKNEIDAGGIIQIDAYDSESEEAIGTGDNLGHAVTIVGYIMPKEGNQAPYYIIWNPWWDTTFYISSNAKTFNLGGTKYKWERTWHNWRKTTNTRSAQVLDKAIGDQKVSSTPNPNALKEEKVPLLELGMVTTLNKDLTEFGINKSISNQNVAQYGSPVMWRGSFGAYYGYDSTAPKVGQRRIMRIQSYNTLEAKLYYDTSEAEVWRNAVNNLNSYQGELRKTGITLSIEIPLMLITGNIIRAGLIGANAIKKISTYSVSILMGVGIIGDNNPFGIATTLYNYYNLKEQIIKYAERCYFADGPI